jgi:hypothetical protein
MPGYRMHVSPELGIVKLGDHSSPVNIVVIEYPDLCRSTCLLEERSQVVGDELCLALL